MKNLIGGFASINTGIIKNCHSSVNISVKSPVSGFCVDNKGQIINSLFDGKIKKFKDTASGLCQKQNGSLENSVWIMMEDHDYTDEILAVNKDDLTIEKLPEIIRNWNFKNCWYLDNKQLSIIKSETETDYTNVIEIFTKEDLFAFAEDVNNGIVDKNTVYKLMNDIDLKGKDWTPIGVDTNYPFNCTFDGGNYTIKNFKVKSNKYSYAGMFGYVDNSGVIKNLTVDCMISKNGNMSGAICGFNKGKIINCIARVITSVNRYTGGFVGQNAGEIHQCSVFGIIKPILPILWFVPLLVIPTILIIVLFGIRGSGDDFTPIVLDPNVEVIEEKLKEPEDLTKTNNSFIMNRDVLLNNGVAQVNLKCPTWSDKGFVATYKYNGKEIYKTGLIVPGYEIDAIRLPDLNNLSKGNHKVGVLLEFYDTKTYEKHPINTDVYVDVMVK